MAALQGNQVRETMIAGADLSEAQFTFVSMNTTDRTVVATGAGAEAFGVLINNPLSGNAATVVTNGRVIIEVGTGDLAAGDAVASDANGAGVTAGTGDIIVGVCVDGAADGGRATIDFFRGGNESA